MIRRLRARTLVDRKEDRVVREPVGVELTGAILAGGEGRRLGGGKPQRILLGRTLLEHARGLLEPLCQEILVLGPGGLPDAEPGLGPLGGLLTALESARFPRVLAVTVDMPAVAPEVLRALAEREGEAVWCGEPFPALYAVSLAPRLRVFLQESRRAFAFIRSLEPVALEVPAEHRPGLDCNVNTPEDLERAAALLQARRSKPQ